MASREVSRNMLLNCAYSTAQQEHPDRTVVTLGERQMNTALAGSDRDQFAGRIRRNTADVVNFQDPMDQHPSSFLRYAILDESGRLLPQFQAFGSQSAVVQAFAVALIDSLEMAAANGAAFPGTKDYQIDEPENSEEENRKFLLFSREKAQLKPNGEPVAPEELNVQNDIRYIGPRSLPALPIAMVESESGIVTFCFCLSFAEERNMARANVRRTPGGGISFNRWFFGMSLIQLPGTIEAQYERFDPKFPGADHAQHGLLAGVFEYPISTPYTNGATRVVSNYLSGSSFKAAKAAAEYRDRFSRGEVPFVTRKLAKTTAIDESNIG